MAFNRGQEGIQASRRRSGVLLLYCLAIFMLSWSKLVKEALYDVPRTVTEGGTKLLNDDKPIPEAPKSIYIPSRLEAWLPDYRSQQDENTPIEIRDDYWAYIKHLKNFTDKIREYRAPPCSGFNITDWIPPEYLSWHSEFGYAEPLLPVLRHPAYCESQNRQNRFRLDYILHDFDRFCSHTQSRSTRKVFVDMGASPIFHGGKPPAIKLLETYEQFGVHFDHIYAYEMTKLDPEAVFNALPPRFISNYHWINVAVDVNEGSDRNPFTMLMNSFTKDDFVVLKIDIDHGESETELFRQLLASEQLQELVDVFYFEHHVHLYELAGFWGASMKGSVYDSLAMFSRLRHAGIASHHWI